MYTEGHVPLSAATGGDVRGRVSEETMSFIWLWARGKRTGNQRDGSLQRSVWSGVGTLKGRLPRPWVSRRFGSPPGGQRAVLREMPHRAREP